MSRPHLITALLVFTPLACGDSSVATEGDTTAATGEGTTDSDATTSATTGGPVPALGGIEVTAIVVNQGVAIPLVDEGAEVEPDSRAAPVVQAREMLVRALWTVPIDWTQRPVTARLTLVAPGGEPETLEQSLEIAGPPDPTSMDGTFAWTLTRDQVVPGLEYRVDLFEAEPAPDDAEIPEGDEPPAYPLAPDGYATFGVEDSDQRIVVTMVPVDVVNGTIAQPLCTSSLSEIPEEVRQRFADALYEANPVDTVEFTWHDPVPYESPGPLVALGEINAMLAALREEEGEAPDRPEVYYYGLIDVCDSTLIGLAGKAGGIPESPSMEDTALRVATGVLETEVAMGGEDVEERLEAVVATFVHEFGHCQGLPHVLCTGDETNPDLNYPELLGALDSRGWSPIDGELREPDAYADYMTYCEPSWVSAYHWNKTHHTIATLSSWDD